MVKVCSSEPPGVLLISSIGDSKVLGDLVMLLLTQGFGHIAVLVVAALHGIKPVHAIVASVAVAGACVRLDEHVTLVRSSSPW